MQSTTGDTGPSANGLEGLKDFELNKALIAMTVRQHELNQQSEQARQQAERLAAALHISEQRLRDSEQRLRDVLASSPMAIVTCDRDAVLQFYNARAAELWGREPKIGAGPHGGSWALWKPEGAAIPQEQSPIMEVLRTGKPIRNVELAIERPDGSRLPVLVDCAALTDQAGSITGAITSFIDITARKQAERALQASEAFNRGVFESSPDCVMVLDGDARLLRMNSNGLRVMEIDDFAPLAGRAWVDFWPPDERADLEATLAVARAGAVGQFHGHCATAKGTDRWWDVNVSAVIDAQGAVANFIAVWRDVTRREEIERALREEDRRKSEFLAMLAHELRNPLAPIRNAVHMLRMAGDQHDIVRSASEMMERQVRQMARLVDDLLDASRLDRGKVTLRIERVQLAPIAQMALESVRPMVEAAQQQLTVTVPLDPIWLDADASRLAQVFSNLLTNASKFTNEGGSISFVVELAGRSADGAPGEAIVRVRDSGIGIAPDQLPRIFDIFVQVDSSLGRSASGLGIGLTLVKQLVEMHRGSVEVHSAGLGQGTEFIARLPIPADAGKRVAPEARASAVQIALGRRILIVDDNRDAAESLSMLLQMSQHDTFIAHDGEQAIASAAEIEPEVMLVDIGLPKLDGYQVAREIRTRPGGKHILLIALTGWGQDKDRQKSKTAGFDAHLVKPVNVDELVRLLARSNG